MFHFYRNKQLNCIGCSIVCKIVFCSEFPDIPDKAGRKTKNAITSLFFLIFLHSSLALSSQFLKRCYIWADVAYAEINFTLTLKTSSLPKQIRIAVFWTPTHEIMLTRYDICVHLYLIRCLITHVTE